MAKLGAGAALAQKSRAPDRRIGAGRADEFYGDVVAEERAVREVHLAHPAAGESAANLVLAIQERSSGQHRGDCTWSAIESERMLRVRLATNLLFNLVLAIWVFHDAQDRGAHGSRCLPSLLTLLWGPLGVAFWVSDRPLATTDERHGGTAWVMARTFVLAITALVPAAFLLITSVVRDRSAVPGSLGARIGRRARGAERDGDGLGAPRWSGYGARRPLAQWRAVEPGTSAVTSASPGLGAALAIAGTAAFVLALTASGL